MSSRKFNIKKTVLFVIPFLVSMALVSCSDNTTSVTSGPPSDLTRTGKFIAFSSTLAGAFDVYLVQVNTDGTIATTGLVYSTNPYNLTAISNPAMSDKQPNWSPNGRIMVYSRQTSASGTEEVFAFYFNSAGAVDTTISPNPQQLMSSGGNWDENPQFSPDGKYLVWDRREDNQTPIGTIDTSDFRDLMRGDINYDTLGRILNISAVTKLTNTMNSDEYDPKWSPRISVQRIAYTLHTSSSSNDFDIYIMDPFNTSTNSNFFNPGRSSYPAWAPACDKIFFEADQGNGGYFKIVYLAYPTNNGNLNNLVQSSTQDLRSPTRMPNADKIAYLRIDPASLKGMIWVTSATNGGDGIKLLPSSFDAADNRWPAW